MTSSLLGAVLILSLLSRTTSALPAQRGPQIDRLRFKVITSPEAQLLAMQTGAIDVLTALIRPSDLETLDRGGFTITSAPAFHMVQMVFNVRPNRDYLGVYHTCHPEAVEVLSDVNFRHACFHAYEQEGICVSIHSYTVTPIQSLVPPAQGAWLNPSVPKHPYNPGDPTAVTEYPEDHSSCGTLRYGGYLYSTTLHNWVTPYDLDEDGTPGTNHPNRPLEILDPDDVVPDIDVYSPSYEVVPWNSRHARRWVDELNGLGLDSIWHWPGGPCGQWYDQVFNEADFDIAMVPWLVGKFPNHLYAMCHSSQDNAANPMVFITNVAGINDPVLDELVERVKFSLNPMERIGACHEAQYWLFGETDSQALAYMPMYSRLHFDAFEPNLRGIVNSPGYGTDNMWTALNLRWAPGYARLEEGESLAVWGLGAEPATLNPLQTPSSPFAWQLITPLTDALIAPNPYTLGDVPWMAQNWTLEVPLNVTVTLDSDWYQGEGVRYKSAGDTHTLVNGMRVTFGLNDTVQWHCGNPYTAADAAFNWEFLRNNQIPGYTSVSTHLVDVQVINPETVTVYLDVPDQFALYDLATTAALLPPPVWTPLDGRPLDALLAYTPSTNTTKPAGAGPRFGTTACPTQLYGTGPFIFAAYNPTRLEADLHANRAYWQTTAEIHQQMVDLFHRVGDVDSDGVVAAGDLNAYSLAFGTEPPSNPDADINGDGRVDGEDGALIGYHLVKKREYP